jgi:hypothetical protein
MEMLSVHFIHLLDLTRSSFKTVGTLVGIRYVAL